MPATSARTDARLAPGFAPPPGWRASVPAPADPHAAGPSRLLSIDVLRGVIVALMVLVNHPGHWSAAYAPLRHAQWVGWTLADTIAPTFLWVVGLVLALSDGRPGPDGRVRRRTFSAVVRRSAVLFGLGLLIAATPRVVPLLDFSVLATLRIPGTLQRIALCYLAASALHRTVGTRGLAAWTVALVAGYWALMTLVPVPGYGAGVLTPAGNLHAYVDRLVLGVHAKRMDPLGVLSTLPSIATTLFGVMTGRWLRGRRADGATSLQLAGAAAALVALGQLLAVWIPVSGGLCTPSFILFMAGVSTGAFAACHWLVDVRRSTWWTRPFAVYGVNTLAVFVLSQMLANALVGVGVPGLGREWASLQGIVFDGFYLRAFAPPEVASLLHALTWTLGFFALSCLLYRKRWFLKA